MRRLFFSLFLLLSAFSARAQYNMQVWKDGKYVSFSIANVDSIRFVRLVTTCPDDNHPHAIDLGLPSGTKWACCNVGASTPEGYGGYYAWGETSEKSVYNSSTYAYYNSNTGYVNIGTDIAGTSYDVARVRMGAPWSMPSIAQILELYNICTGQWLQYNDVYGILVTGPSGGQVFFPAAGYHWNDIFSYPDSYGYYWSSSLYQNLDHTAYNLYVTDSWGWMNTGYDRAYGLSVRAVCP